MAQKSESELTRELCEYFKAQGAVCFAIVGGEMQEAGWPDRYIAYQGCSFWLEFKLDTKCSPLQQAKLKALRRVNVVAWVVRHLENDLLQLEDPDGHPVAVVSKGYLLNWLLCAQA